MSKVEELDKFLMATPFIPDPLKGDIVTYDFNNKGELIEKRRESKRVRYLINKITNRWVK